MVGNRPPIDLNHLRRDANDEGQEKELTKEEKIAALRADITRLETQDDPQPDHERFAALSEADQQAEVDRVRRNRWSGIANPPPFTIADRLAELKHQHEVGPNMRLLRIKMKKAELEKLLEEK